MWPSTSMSPTNVNFCDDWSVSRTLQSHLLSLLPQPCRLSQLLYFPLTWSHGLSNPSWSCCVFFHPHLSIMLSLQLFYFMNLDSFFKAQIKTFPSGMSFTVSLRHNSSLPHWDARIFCMLYISHCVILGFIHICFPIRVWKDHILFLPVLGI